MAQWTTRGCNRPATGELEIRRTGAEYDILYVCDEHCPDPGRVENKKVD